MSTETAIPDLQVLGEYLGGQGLNPADRTQLGVCVAVLCQQWPAIDTVTGIRLVNEMASIVFNLGALFNAAPGLREALEARWAEDDSGPASHGGA